MYSCQTSNPIHQFMKSIHLISDHPWLLNCSSPIVNAFLHVFWVRSQAMGLKSFRVQCVYHAVWSLLCTLSCHNSDHEVLISWSIPHTPSAASLKAGPNMNRGNCSFQLPFNRSIMKAVTALYGWSFYGSSCQPGVQTSLAQSYLPKSRVRAFSWITILCQI